MTKYLKTKHGWIPVWNYYTKRAVFWFAIALLLISIALTTGCATNCEPCPPKSDVQAAMDMVKSMYYVETGCGC